MRRTLRCLSIVAGLLLAAGIAPAADAPRVHDWSAQRLKWNRPAAPFRMIGNVYFVGTAGLSAFLITDPKGHVLIDGGLPESAAQIADHIRELGFRLADVRILLLNHAHFDHAGGLAELKRLTGARLFVSAGDRADVESGHTVGREDHDPFPAVKVDQLLRDGEQIRVGQTVLTAHLTPGHTKGCTTFSYGTKEGPRAIDVLFVCSLTVAGQDLSGGPVYPAAVADYRATFAKLRSMHADVFVNFHTDAFDLPAKRARQLAGDPLAFVDPRELGRQVDSFEAAFEKELAVAKQPAAASP
jgi:metallo-beta-lactamase class B